MESKPCLFKISGSINTEKHKEFEQTVRFVFKLLPHSCFSSHLALDVFNTNVYHLFMLWSSDAELDAFKHSNEYHVIKGSFQTLGLMDTYVTATCLDVHGFEMNDADT